MIIRYTEWLLRWKYAVVVTTLLLVALLAAGLPRLHFTNDYRVFFSKENPQLLAFENLQNTYTKNDNVLFVITPKDGKVFTPETLTAVRDITKA
ncbi:MAG TPA: RND transporter, partial [Gammaproteobacteria bacterium]|nr:RND transporter [Gammaproteobacteria bacterium]